MKIKSILFFLYVLLVAFKGVSQEELSSSEIENLKTAVKESAANTKTITSDFDQIKHIDVLENDIPASGKLLFKAPNSIRWEYADPEPMVAIFKGETLLVDNKGEKDTYKLTSNKMFRSLNTLIKGSLNGDMFNDSEFDISYFKDEKGYRVNFIPKEKKLRKFIASFEMRFVKSTKDVSAVKLIEPNGDYTQILFRNRKLNSAVSDSNFKN